MPPRRQVQRLPMDPATWISPVQIDPEPSVTGKAAQAEVQVRAALPGVAVPAIHLSHKPPPVREVNDRGGTNRRPPWRVSPWMTRTDFRSRQFIRAERQQQVESQKCSGIGALITVEIGGFPLVRHGEVQIAVAIDVGRRDSPTDLASAEA